jgi:hypothetical protein
MDAILSRGLWPQKLQLALQDAQLALETRFYTIMRLAGLVR